MVIGDIAGVLIKCHQKDLQSIPVLFLGSCETIRATCSITCFLGSKWSRSSHVSYCRWHDFQSPRLLSRFIFVYTTWPGSDPFDLNYKNNTVEHTINQEQ